MTRIDFESKKFQKEFDSFLEKNDQRDGYSVNFGIIEKKDNVYISKLDPFTLVWKFTFYLDQYATATVQHGDIALVNKDGKNNSDTPVSRNCGVHQCWFNACISTRTVGFSRMEL